MSVQWTDYHTSPSIWMLCSKKSKKSKKSKTERLTKAIYFGWWWGLVAVIVEVIQGAGFEALGPLVAVTRGYRPLLCNIFLGDERVYWSSKSLWSLPGSDGERLSVRGPFKAKGNRHTVRRGRCALGTCRGTAWLSWWIRLACRGAAIAWNESHQPQMRKLHEA